MIGFLVAGALAGTAAVAWPLYLHLRRRRKPVVQVVPSLHLFATATKRARVRLFEQLPLMLARALFLLAGALLVSQPYLSSARDLPLPRLQSSGKEDRCVGVLLDDSLSSLHGPAGDTRLDRGVRWLKREIGSLDERTRVTIALTSLPYPTRPMRRDRALELLGRARTVPRRGDAPRSLARLVERLAGLSGAVVVAAPRDGELWRDLAEGTDLERATSIHFLDTTATRLGWHIHSIERASAGAGGSAWTCNFAGDVSAMARGVLTVANQEDREWHYEITAHDAQRGKLGFLLPRCEDSGWYVARASDRGHAWHTWHFGGGGGTRGVARGVTIMRRATREALAVEKLVTAALMAARPESPLHHVDTDSPPDPLPDTGAVVCIGPPPAAGATCAWIESVLACGGRVLTVPTGARTPARAPGAPGADLPAWGAARAATRAEIVPLKGDAGSTGEAGRIAGVLVRGLNEANYDAVCPLEVREGEEIVLATSSNTPFLVARSFPAGGRSWTLATPLSVAEDGLAGHGAFPLLVDRLLFGEGEEKPVQTGQVEVGHTVDLREWFAPVTAPGVVVTPHGVRQEIARVDGPPVWTNVASPGAYLFKAGESLRARLANYPRLDRDVSFSRERWETRRPNSRATWLETSDRLPRAFVTIAATRDDDDPGRYDLTGVAMALVTFALVTEGALLLWCWRRKVTHE